MTVQANCHEKENYTWDPFTLTNTDGKNYTATIWSMDSTCYVGYTSGCFWGPYIIEAIIPDEDVEKIGDSVRKMNVSCPFCSVHSCSVLNSP